MLECIRFRGMVAAADAEQQHTPQNLHTQHGRWAQHMKSLATFVALMTFVGAAVADPKTNALIKAVLDVRRLGSITSNQVPERFHVARASERQGRYLISTFYRGDHCVMRLKERDDVGDRGIFDGQLLDGTTVVARLAGSFGGVAVIPRTAPEQYQITVFVDGRTNSCAMVRSRAGGFRETYRLEGTNSRPVEALEYFQGVMFAEEVWKPFVDVVTNENGRPINAGQ